MTFTQLCRLLNFNINKYELSQPIFIEVVEEKTAHELFTWDFDILIFIYKGIKRLKSLCP